MNIKILFSCCLVALCCLTSGCAKLQNEREFDTPEHALSFELESSESAARLTASIQAEGSDSTLDVELAMSTGDDEYTSEPVHLESGRYTISSLSVYGTDDATIYSLSNLSVTLESDSTVSLD